MSANAWVGLGELSSRIALTMFHNLWQAALVGVIVWGLLVLLRRSSPRARYAVCLLGILSIVVITVSTFTLLQSQVSSSGRSPTTPERASTPAVASGAASDSPSEVEIPRSEVATVPDLATTLDGADPTVSAPEGASEFPVVATSSPISPATETPWGAILRSRILEWSPWIAGFWLLGVLALGGRSLGDRWARGSPRVA